MGNDAKTKMIVDLVNSTSLKVRGLKIVCKQKEKAENPWIDVNLIDCDSKKVLRKAEVKGWENALICVTNIHCKEAIGEVQG